MDCNVFWARKSPHEEEECVRSCVDSGEKMIGAFRRNVQEIQIGCGFETTDNSAIIELIIVTSCGFQGMFAYAGIDEWFPFRIKPGAVEEFLNDSGLLCGRTSAREFRTTSIVASQDLVGRRAYVDQPDFHSMRLSLRRCRKESE